MSDAFSDVMSEKMEVVLGVMDVDLEGRFAKVRTEETNLGECKDCSWSSFSLVPCRAESNHSAHPV